MQTFLGARCALSTWRSEKGREEAAGAAEVWQPWREEAGKMASGMLRNDTRMPVQIEGEIEGSRREGGRQAGRGRYPIAAAELMLMMMMMKGERRLRRCGKPKECSIYMPEPAPAAATMNHSVLECHECFWTSVR
ncbi:hypothetical protein MPTK1_8g03970 [Marchantia polymorpha subsp. ruderalis]|uniref:Uncharacterized protein n=1 Tax=Marchantia polymorpha TaxID=3197 RepID=A0A2R6XJK8_MARPO|nr:hypothetical protein MARPO_0012s0187 [Marchantia polymorpha]BBN18615.1 hypothetical protein Mp_8g03970 [Marchantia polymorpha subsp. ruderalis]|eukprot:PTQ46262.1 hypothetical protein MARPO_0012s0187 [Marchantia polymorpha]